jgi:hypothetical protein
MIHRFALSKDGKLLWLKDVPEEPVPYGVGDEQYYGSRMDAYQQALQSSIDNAVEVSNTTDVFFEIGLIMEPGKVYSIECEVETGLLNGDDWRKKKWVALVTFPEQREEERCPFSEMVKNNQESDLGSPSGLEQKDGWISVNERLPEEWVEVLCFGYMGSMAVGSIWAEVDKDGYFAESTTGQLDDVTHWMPLPSPPKQ